MVSLTGAIESESDAMVSLNGAIESESDAMVSLIGAIESESDGLVSLTGAIESESDRPVSLTGAMVSEMDGPVSGAPPDRLSPRLGKAPTSQAVTTTSAFSYQTYMRLHRERHSSCSTSGP